MQLRDLIVTPLTIILIYVVAYLVRPYCTDLTTRKYFLPGLTVRIFGALAVGFIYQFYYAGGDTYNFHTYGSRVIWEACMDSPAKGVKLLLAKPGDFRDVYEYASRIRFFTDPASYAIVRIAAFFDLFTFSSYSATATLFSVVGFIGSWLFFITFYNQYPHLHKRLAIASLFIPSVFFWGSGLLKDTITLACLGAATYSCWKIFFKKQSSLLLIALLLVSLYGMLTIKIYILMAFLPSAILWIFFSKYRKIQSAILRMMVLPVIIAASVALGYFATLKASAENPKYSLDAIAKTAQVTAYDIRYWTGRNAGSGYSLGELDGSLESMLKLAPQAINVALFRPYLWEVNNPLMLLSALESFVITLLVLRLIVTKRLAFFQTLTHPDVLFSLTFAIIFGFAVGVSTFNFGTLVRYKIPMMPFFVIAIILISDQLKRERKLT